VDTNQAVDLPGYEAVLNGAAYYVRQGGGFLRLTGSTRLDFIQRQTTNDVNLLSADRVVTTVLTTPNARMLDVWQMIKEGDAVGIITLPGHDSSTTNFLQNRIFFADEVVVENRSGELAQLELAGPEIGSLLRRFGLAEPPSPDRVAPIVIDGVEGRLLGQRGIGENGALLLVPSGSVAQVAEALESGDASPLAAESYQALRIEAGLPATGAELTDDYTPLEAGLDYAISDSKGCYTGQEIIARQLTYDKVTRHLAGLRLQGPVPAGAAVLAEGRSVGVVTSYVDSPRFGCIGLAYVKRPHHEPGVEVAVGESAGVEAVVEALPFG
jgi:folate-binding protein YgfZ